MEDAKNEGGQKRWTEGRREVFGTFEIHSNTFEIWRI